MARGATLPLRAAPAPEPPVVPGLPAGAPLRGRAALEGERDCIAIQERAGEGSASRSLRSSAERRGDGFSDSPMI